MINTHETQTIIHLKTIHGPTNSQKIMNDAIRKQLLKHGDFGIVPRDVRHYIFPDTDDHPEPADFLGDYMICEDVDIAITKDGQSIRISHDVEVASPEFDGFTEALAERVEEFGWKYDGWECELVTKHSFN